MGFLGGEQRRTGIATPPRLNMQAALAEQACRRVLGHGAERGLGAFGIAGKLRRLRCQKARQWLVAQQTVGIGGSTPRTGQVARADGDRPRDTAAQPRVARRLRNAMATISGERNTSRISDQMRIAPAIAASNALAATVTLAGYASPARRWAPRRADRPARRHRRLQRKDEEIDDKPYHGALPASWARICRFRVSMSASAFLARRYVGEDRLGRVTCAGGQRRDLLGSAGHVVAQQRRGNPSRGGVRFAGARRLGPLRPGAR